MANTRKSGVKIIGNIPWGIHICQFYSNEQDLIDILVPFFKAGLENNEFCMWITSKPLRAAEAMAALKKEVKNLDSYVAKKQIEILEADQWYTKRGKFEAEKVLAGWVGKEKQALKNGFDGLRVSGNSFWLDSSDWQDFSDYEKVVNSVIGNYKMLAICSYSLDKCGPSEAVDVISHHQFALIKKKGQWRLVENIEYLKKEQALSEANSRLQVLQRVTEAVHSSLDLEKVFKQITDNAVHFMGYSTSFIAILDEEKKHFEIKALSSKEKLLPQINKMLGFSLRNFLIPADTELSPAIKSVLEGRILITETLVGAVYPLINKRICSMLQKISGSKTYILLPMKIEKEIVGGIFLAYSQEAVSEEELRMIESFASVAATAIKNARLHLKAIQAEKAQRKSQKQYEELWNNAPAAYHVLDRYGIIARVNQTEARMLGYTKKEMLGRSIFDFIHPSQREGARKRFLKKISGQHLPREKDRIYIRKDGTQIYVDIDDVLEWDESGKIIGVRTTMVDVTEQRKAEEKLRLEKAYLDKLFESAQEGGVMSDKEGQIVRVNEEFIRLFGYTAEELKGRFIDELVVPEKELAKGILITKKIANGENVAFEAIRQRKDGKLIDVSILGSPIILDGEVVAIYAIYRDITKRKRAEEELKESEEKYRIQFEGALDAIFIADAETGILINCNKAASKLVGRAKSELIGKPQRILHPSEEIKEKFSRTFKSHLNEKKGRTLETQVITKSGEKKDVAIKANLYELKGRKVLQGIFRDITESKKVEKVKSSIYKISEAGLKAEDIGEFYSLIHKTISELMPGSNFYIAFYDPDSEMLNFPYFVDEYEQNPGPQKLGRGLTEYVLRTGKPLLASPQVFEKLEKKGEVVSVGPPSIDWLGIPLKTREKTFGVLVVQTYTEGVRYSEEDKNILSYIAEQVSMTIERKRVEEQIRKQSAVLKAINRVFHETLVCESEEEVAQACLSVAEELTGSQFGFVGKVNERGRMDTIAQSDTGWKACKIPESDAILMINNMEIRGIWGKVLKDKQPLIVNDPASHPSRVGTPEGHPPIKSFLGVPLKHGGRTVGMIALANKKRGYDLDDQRAIEDLSFAFVEALYRKRAEEALRVSEGKYRNLVEMSPDAVLMLDMKGMIIACNTFMARATGYSKEEIVGKHLPELELLPAEDVPNYIKIISSAARGRIHKPFEVEWNHKNGTPFLAEVRLGFIKENGKKVGVQVVARDITERKQAEEKIKAALAEKEVMLREIHHRVKNNMQIISSLLRLQSRQIKNKKVLDIFNVSQNRIRSMALVHESLYRSSDLSMINFSDYIRRLVLHLFSMYRTPMGNVTSRVEVGDVFLDINRAIPCGLIINELVSNSLKYAFPNGKKGEIAVKMAMDNKRKYILVVKDTGIGFPEGIDFHQTDSLGMQLVTDLTKQLDGTIKLKKAEGTEFKIVF